MTNHATCVRLERNEARRMLDELFATLTRTGRLNLTDLARRATLHGFPVSRRQVLRWKSGDATPYTVDRVEAFARAIGVDWAFLMDVAAELDDPVPFLLTSAGVAAVTR